MFKSVLDRLLTLTFKGTKTKKDRDHTPLAGQRGHVEIRSRRSGLTAVRFKSASLAAGSGTQLETGSTERDSGDTESRTVSAWKLHNTTFTKSFVGSFFFNLLFLMRFINFILVFVLLLY